MLWVFFGNFIFALIARTFSGNRLKNSHVQRCSSFHCFTSDEQKKVLDRWRFEPAISSLDHLRLILCQLLGRYTGPTQPSLTVVFFGFFIARRHTVTFKQKRQVSVDCIAKRWGIVWVTIHVYTDWNLAWRLTRHKRPLSFVARTDALTVIFFSENMVNLTTLLVDHICMTHLLLY